ncbi:MAG: DUF429 domain-containing protein [Verrucomicrobiota bacterium JB023]|nr:DUF429 domain-containing protein [Verrucomicrobiota bacterium JB023]
MANDFRNDLSEGRHLDRPASSQSIAVGIDACRGGWIAASGEEPGLRVFGSFDSLADSFPEGSILMVDIPIGLPDGDSAGRECDRLARQGLAPRRGSSVFPAPLRATLAADSYEEACHLSSQLCGKKLSKQTFNILPKVREVDTYLRGTARHRVWECHPELAFCGLNGGTPLLHSKKTDEGKQERLDLLAPIIPGVQDIYAKTLAGIPRLQAAADDILDALVNFSVASAPPERWRILPPTPPEDLCGLPMGILFADYSP